VYEEAGSEEKGKAEDKGEERIESVESQPPVGDVGGQYSEGGMSDIDDFHHSPGKAESYPEKGKNSSYEEATHHRLDDNSGIEHSSQKVKG